MIDLRSLHLRMAAKPTRKEMYEGREHLVIPVVALMEGVVHAVNAATPEFVPLASLKAAARTWNGRPITLGHPVLGRTPVSANDHRVLESQAFGVVFNSRVEGTKLLCDAWVDVEKAKRIGAGDLLQALIDGKTTEVSVGAYVNMGEVEGFHGGKAYKGRWDGVTADHLAFLPKGRGACSVEMGCGTHRAAEEAETTNDIVLYNLEGGDVEVASGTEPVITLARKVERTPLSQAAGRWLKQAMGAKEENTMNREAMIKALAECECNGLTEEMLKDASDELLQALTESAATQKETADKLKAAEAKVTETADKLKVAEGKLKTASEKVLSEDEFMAAAPASIKTLIERQKAADTKRTNELLEVLKTAQKEYTEDELKAMSVDELERVARLAKAEVPTSTPDFSGRGIPRVAAQKVDDFTPPDSYAKGIKALQESGK